MFVGYSDIPSEFLKVAFKGWLWKGSLDAVVESMPEQQSCPCGGCELCAEVVEASVVELVHVVDFVQWHVEQCGGCSEPRWVLGIGCKPILFGELDCSVGHSALVDGVLSDGQGVVFCFLQL